MMRRVRLEVIALTAIVLLTTIAPTVGLAGAPHRQGAEYQTRRVIERQGYGERVTYFYRGKKVQRYTYPGYVNGFAPPAYLYFGYPQSGYSYGPGL